MRLKLVVVGKLKDSGLRALVEEYDKRIRRHVEIQQLEVKDAAALRKHISEQEWVVALEVKGLQLDSTSFAERLQDWGERKSGRITFLIGGADGIPSELSKRANARLSLSTMTLPHRLARLLLCEQLYRATTIWRGEPYARED